MSRWEDKFWTPRVKENMGDLHEVCSKDRKQKKIWFRGKTERTAQCGQGGLSVPRDTRMPLPVSFNSTINSTHSRKGQLILSASPLWHLCLPLCQSSPLIVLEIPWEVSPDPPQLVLLAMLCPASPRTIRRNSIWRLWSLSILCPSAYVLCP